jgi:cell division protein ZapA
MEHLVTVIIQGEQYTIRATDDPTYVRRVAQYVDEKLEGVVSGSPSLPSTKAIVLASLNIADELFKREAERERSEASVAARLGELSDLLGAELTP